MSGAKWQSIESRYVRAVRAEICSGSSAKFPTLSMEGQVPQGRHAQQPGRKRMLLGLLSVLPVQRVHQVECGQAHGAGDRLRHQVNPAHVREH